jgi:hypothetical protein
MDSEEGHRRTRTDMDEVDSMDGVDGVDEAFCRPVGA